MKKTVYIVCEGPSEKAYISEVVKYFRDVEGIELHLIPKVVGTGHYSSVRDKYRGVFNSQRKIPNVKIWVDKDIYLRNDRNNGNNYVKHHEDGLPDFLFSYMNGEDFLAMHDEGFEKWESICHKNKHFHKPMHKDEYIPLIKENLFPDYKKGELPFDIDLERLKCLFRNQNKNHGKNDAIHCDFADFLKEVLDKAGITL